MITRRNMLKALGIGGLLPFVRGDDLQAAPLKAPEPQVQPKTITMGSANAPRQAFTCASGTASFSFDGGLNWHELGGLMTTDDTASMIEMMNE